MLKIPKHVAKLDNFIDGIPDQVAELPQDYQVPEARPYKISFAKYNNKMCEIDFLTSNKARKAILELKKIGTKVCSEEDFSKCKIDRIPIDKKGEYLKLYRGLDETIEIKEIKLQEDARVFYFDIESESILYIVAIRQNHLETKKNRRKF